MLNIAISEDDQQFQRVERVGIVDRVGKIGYRQIEGNKHKSSEPLFYAGFMVFYAYFD